MSTPKKKTVAQIKQEITELGAKPPSGFNKAELSMYLDGLQKGGQSAIIKNAQQDFVGCRHVSTRENVIETVDKYGWCIVPTNVDPNEISGQLFEYLSQSCPRFDPQDQSTWINKNLPFRYKGIFKHEVGHLEPLWQVRTQVKNIFQEIYQEKDLITSFDGFCFLEPHCTRTRQWFHLDQSRKRVDREVLQGLINLNENGLEDGGTLFVEGSHKLFEEYTQAYLLDGIKGYPKVDLSWYSQKMETLKIVKPILHPGEMLLWDSRTVHCNTPPAGERYRMCTYVSMVPKKGVSKADLAKRAKYYQDLRTTNHHCSGRGLMTQPRKPNPMYAQDFPDLIPAEKVRPKDTSERRKLVC